MTLGFDGAQTSVNSRLTKFITDSVAAGRSWGLIMPVAAVSVNESASIFIRDRSPSGTLLPANCYAGRQVLALERGNPMLGNTFPGSWRNDPEIIAMLADRGWLGTGNATTQAFAACDCPSSPNDNLAWFFEWLIDRRKLVALEAFSVGATQVYMDYSPLTNGTMQSRFPTIENLWGFYTATTVAQLWDYSPWGYLPNNATPKENWTVGGDTSSGTSIERWLQTYQTGSVNWELDVWRNYASRFQAAVRNVWNIGRQLGVATG